MQLNVCPKGAEGQRHRGVDAEIAETRPVSYDLGWTLLRLGGCILCSPVPSVPFAPFLSCILA
ncbi:hypothetical protein COZ71_03240 [Candidatus Desantisbacteria bacterium CG_4_8_14_3_um_filter_40_12]|uniref:Uncharacterized protein n=1 Tax=Candidatus Desantisbacteria bacterium CG_4_8_14_3_um_filter_40_12 TaxID=1974545 RepID=A0A2M7JDI4_9BACT|nr:MAG: hypothetical protein COZ71_03240 [Candidatus Desantisbacteria bacterium CG_4_8_14_3_um_filter_40_12]